MTNNVSELTQALREIMEAEKPAPIDERYEIFGSGEHKGKEFTRKKAVYGLQIEIDKVRLQSTSIDLEIKELIARRHGWGRYEVDDELKYGKGYIGENFTEIEVLERILKLITEMPNTYKIKDLDTGEAERLINDFLLSCRV